MGEKVKGRVKPKRRRKLLRYLRQSKGVSMGSLRQVSALRGRVYLLVRIRATWRAISTQLVFPLRVELGKYGIENEGGEVQVGTIQYLSTKNLSGLEPSRQFSFSALQSLPFFPFNSKSPDPWPEVWAASSLAQHLAYVSLPCTTEVQSRSLNRHQSFYCTCLVKLRLL